MKRPRHKQRVPGRTAMPIVGAAAGLLSMLQPAAAAPTIDRTASADRIVLTDGHGLAYADCVPTGGVAGSKGCMPIR